MSGTELLRVDERDVAAWDDQADVVVVGYGCAGVCTALEARAAGGDVLVLERSGGPGGTSINSGGFLYCGGGTALQRALGYDDSVENMYAYMMAACGPEPDAALIQAYCEGSVAHFDWILEKGVPYKESFFAGAHEPFHSDDGLVYSGSEFAWPFNEIATPAPRGHAPQTIQDKGALLMNKLIAAAVAAGVRTAFGTRVESLVQAGDGRVVGAIAHTVEGRKRIRARKGLVLTAGGFIYNEDMLSRYAPLLKQCRYKVGTETDDGSGIRLGLAVGGEAIRMETGDISLPVFPPNDLRFGICLSEQGQRFINEDVYFGRIGEYALMHQAGRVFLLVDDEHFGRPENFPIEIAAAGETIEEVEAELGMPRGALVNTVAVYNEYAARGEDPLFHKGADWLAPIATPPFGVIDLSTESFVYTAFTLGGLWIDPQARVRSGGGDPIPGLYAAGRTTSGVAKQGYSSGMSLGDGSFFGRAAGRHAMTSRT